MNPNVKVYYQEVEMRAVLENYVNGFKPPSEGKIIQWDANYDSHTGKVWFRLTVEMPAPDEKNIFIMDFDKTIKQVPNEPKKN